MCLFFLSKKIFDWEKALMIQTAPRVHQVSAGCFRTSVHVALGPCKTELQGTFAGPSNDSGWKSGLCPSLGHVLCDHYGR